MLKCGREYSRIGPGDRSLETEADARAELEIMTPIGARIHGPKRRRDYGLRAETDRGIADIEANHAPAAWIEFEDSPYIDREVGARDGVGERISREMNESRPDFRVDSEAAGAVPQQTAEETLRFTPAAAQVLVISGKEICFSLDRKKLIHIVGHSWADANLGNPEVAEPQDRELGAHLDFRVRRRCLGERILVGEGDDS